MMGMGSARKKKRKKGKLLESSKESGKKETRAWAVAF